MKQPDELSCLVTPLPERIGPYKIVKKIASGGMGEVFLAIDPFCQRNLALKKIRSDRMKQPGFRERFLQEVRIAAKLSHPGIIPIYQIHQTLDEIYYTMPLVEGETLKEIIKTSLHREKEGLPGHPIGSSIPALMRIFLNICQAIAYSHSKNILHRDLKPENIIIGTYGEVLILDWGLADFVSSTEEEPIFEEEADSPPGLTRPGKIAGTLAYLAPERIFGKKASFASDIYSLGIILYQLLTLRFPFKRKSVKQYKKELPHESIVPPAERAPYRDIPPRLAGIAKKCLAKRPENRYGSVEEILTDLNNYIEGHAEWVPYATLHVHSGSDWRFRENILLAKHIALTIKSDVMEWVNVMIAKESFPGKIKLETHVHVKEEGKGLGFLLNLKPPEEGKEFLQDSFFIWIGSESNPGCHLFRSNAELMSNPNLHLKNGLSHFIRIEKSDHHIQLYIDGHLGFDYLSHTPFHGPLLGILLKDADLELGNILVSKSSPNISVNCLAVPDTLFKLHHFKEALRAYREIASSFAGRSEGKEALFRAGIVLLEEAEKKHRKKEKEQLFEEALEEFNKLKQRGGSPLEYLGKSLVYKATKELVEEVKCLELGMRKFAKHPLIGALKEQTLFRLHEASYKDKVAAYEFALLAIRYVPEAFLKEDNKKLLQHLQKSCGGLYFLGSEETRSHPGIELAFRLGKKTALRELVESGSTVEEKSDAFYCLLYLDDEEFGLEQARKDDSLRSRVLPLLRLLEQGFQQREISEEDLQDFETKRALIFLFDTFPRRTEPERKPIYRVLEKVCRLNLSEEELLFFRKRRICALVYLGKLEEARRELEQIPPELREGKQAPFHLLELCKEEKNGKKRKKMIRRILFEESYRPGTV